MEREGREGTGVLKPGTFTIRAGDNIQGEVDDNMGGKEL